ncbi:peptidase inhibitor 15-like [Mytilus edulis]|uniref:peptidase inhibitor 15-like n=1 Tax=Mytilus edulis TaxID=6550 RepID=UPI0039EE0AB9
MHLLIFTVLLSGVLALPHEHTALGPPLSAENVSDENPPHDDFDSKISEDIAEKLIANAISDKEKSSTENDQQDSSTRKLTDRDIIKAIKREKTENHSYRMKRGRNSVFDYQPGNRGRNLVLGNDLPQKRQVNSATEAASLDIKGVMKPCRLSDEEATRAVAVHRAYRKKESANNMWTMDWNGTLADLAQGLADECTFKHTNLQSPDGVRVGQNLGATTGSDHSIERMVDLYMNEKDNYNYKDHQWIGVVGHYLQVVNWKTIQVGCAMNKCDNLYISTPTQQEVWKNAWYWVCDYWPPVSSKLRPYDYTNGQACSECMVPKDSGLGWKCVDQACRDCKLDGSDPDCQQSKECTEFNDDKDPMCPFIASMGMCGGENFKWALINCQTSCKLCSTVNDAFVE